MNLVSGKSFLVAAVVAVLGLSACSSNPNKERAERPKNPFKSGGAIEAGAKAQLSQRDLKLEATALYVLARRSLEAGDYTDASLRYQSLTQRYPFTEYATQAELERVYTLAKEFKPDEALAAADRFLREHPRHGHADYIQYLKGVVSAERDQGLLENFSFLDNSKGDTTAQRRAFDEFALLLQKYPTSAYNADARARMAALRNRMAEHDLHVVRFYLKRGAYLAAAKRAEQVIALYPGAPATIEALVGLRTSYEAMDMKQQAADAAALYTQQLSAQSPTHLGVKGMSDRLNAYPTAADTAPREKPGAVRRTWRKITRAFGFGAASTTAPSPAVPEATPEASAPTP